MLNSQHWKKRNACARHFSGRFKSSVSTCEKNRSAMTSRVLLWIALLVVAGCRTTQPVTVTLPTSLPEPPAILLPWHDGWLLGGGKVLWWLRDERPIHRWTLPAAVQCGVVDSEDVLWLGTEAGLVRLATPAAWPERVPLPALDRFPSVTALALDLQQRLWLGTEHHGVFQRTDTSWRPVLTAAPIYALATTADSTVWVGTGVGLFRQTPKGWLVYSEEGTANHGLPDNIVERLIALPHGLWIVMSEAVSFFPIGDADHPIEFAYLGHPGNRIHDVVDLPGAGYLLATDDGLVWLRALPHFETSSGLRELRVMEYDLARLLSSETLDLPNAPITRLYRQGDQLYLATTSGLFRQRLSRLIPALLAHY